MAQETCRARDLEVDQDRGAGQEVEVFFAMASVFTNGVKHQNPGSICIILARDRYPWVSCGCVGTISEPGQFDGQISAKSCVSINI